MGICYYVACHDCKVKRDLDKLNPVEFHSRKEATDNYHAISPYRSSLLVAFMKEHLLHNCTLYNDSIECNAMDYKDDYNFWGNE